MKKSHYHHLKDKWSKRHVDLQRKLWSKHREHLDWLSKNYRQLMAGSMGGLMLLTSTAQSLPAPDVSKATAEVRKIDNKSFLISDLEAFLPKDVRELTRSEEKKITEILSRSFGLKVEAELEEKRLNRSYGLIGAEQHLARYPGDTLSTHFDPPVSQEDRELYWQSGMAPGLGAWRYFAPSKSQLKELDIEREKYYIAVQTFLSKDFNSRFREYRDFYKYRKMLVVNPHNGKALVADIADAGPGESTGKHLGGSPEVMHYLERVDGAQKGPVLYFFIDDPNDKIQLGPIEPL
jgi:hypothetical protein